MERMNDKEMQPIEAGQPSSDPAATAEATATQRTPDDALADEGPIRPVERDGTPTSEQMEQDVMTVNPSLDSMESRG